MGLGVFHLLFFHGVLRVCKTLLVYQPPFPRGQQYLSTIFAPLLSSSANCFQAEDILLFLWLFNPPQEILILKLKQHFPRGE